MLYETIFIGRGRWACTLISQAWMSRSVWLSCALILSIRASNSLYSLFTNLRTVPFTCLMCCAIDKPVIGVISTNPAKVATSVDLHPIYCMVCSSLQILFLSSPPFLVSIQNIRLLHFLPNILRSGVVNPHISSLSVYGMYIRCSTYVLLYSYNNLVQLLCIFAGVDPPAFTLISL